MKSCTLRELRRRKGWTQDVLAAKSGVDQTTISGIETNPRANPTFDTVRKLAKALKVRPEHMTFDQSDAQVSQ